MLAVVCCRRPAPNLHKATKTNPRPQESGRLVTIPPMGPAGRRIFVFARKSKQTRLLIVNIGGVILVTTRRPLLQNIAARNIAEYINIHHGRYNFVFSNTQRVTVYRCCCAMKCEWFEYCTCPDCPDSECNEDIFHTIDTGSHSFIYPCSLSTWSLKCCGSASLHLPTRLTVYSI